MDNEQKRDNNPCRRSMHVSRYLADVRLGRRIDIPRPVRNPLRSGKSHTRRMDEQLVRLELEAYRNEIDLLQRQVDYLEANCKELVTMIFKLKNKGNGMND